MRLLAPLSHRPIALLWAGLATSAIGDQLYNVAITWIAIAAFGPAGGFLSAAQAAVTLLVALLIGGWADRRDDRALMIGADLTRAAALGLLIATWQASGGPSAWMLAAAIVVLAGGQSVFRPALQSLLPSITPRRDLLPASNALLDATERIARLTGPALIAALATSLPQVHFLTLDAASFMISAASIASIGAVAHARPPAPRASVLRQVTRGFAALRRDPLLGYLLAVTGLHNGLWYAVIFLGLPLLLRGDGGIGAYGLTIACYGVGNLAANLVVGSRPLPRLPASLICGGNVVNGLGLTLIGAAALTPQAIRLPALLAACALAGAGGPMNDIPRATLMQTVPPPHAIAAGWRAWMVTNNAGTLVAMTIAPAATVALGAATMVMLCGAIVAVTGAYGYNRYAGHVPRAQPA